MKKFKDQLGKQYLKVKEIGGDGNCLFRALSDQLHGEETHHDVLRANAVQHIRDNKEFFVHYIEDDETIEEYCNDMAKSGEWGGQIEMTALATALGFNIIVHQVDHPSMAQILNDPITDFPIVHISYHLGEHYNSVRRIDDAMIKGVPPIQGFPIGHNLDLIA